MSKQAKESPKIGDNNELTFTVTEDQCVEFRSKGIDPVLSTPWLIWSLEHAAHDLLDQFLSDEELSVGIHVDIEHLAVTPIGKKVTCRAKVIHIDRRVINFQVEAHDEKELISKGVHKRQIVKIKQFQKAILNKQNS